MTKPLSHWENLRTYTLQKQKRFLQRRENLAAWVIDSRPAKWTRWGERWVRRDPRLYILEVARYERRRQSWVRVNRALARVKKSLTYIEERLAVRRSAWDLIRAGAKEGAREARRRCNDEHG